MSLDENKAGAAAVDPSDFNTIVDAVVTLQAGGGGSGFAGWTEDETTPANVDSNGGALDLGLGGFQAAEAVLGAVSGTPGLLGLLDGAGGGVVVIPLSVDPTAGGGVQRAAGSLGLRLSPAQVWHKTGAGATDWTQVSGNPSGFFVQASDPGAVGAGAIWIDTTADPLFKQRDPTDTDWTQIPNFVGITVLSGGAASSEKYLFPPFGGGFTIEGDGSKINVDTPLDLGGTGILASGNIDLDGDDLQNVGGFTLTSPPELPAVPTPQDIADALIAAFGFTQAAP